MTSNANKAKISASVDQSYIDRTEMEEEMIEMDAHAVEDGKSRIKTDDFFRYRITKSGEKVYAGLDTIAVCAHLIESHHLFLSDHTTMYRYNDECGVYETLGEGLPEIKTELTTMFGGLANLTQMREVLNTLVNTASIQHTTKDTRERFMHRDKICFKNGVYNMDTDKLEPHSPDVCFVSCVPVVYDPSAKCHKIDEFFDNTFEDPDEECEWIGYCMTPDNWLERMSFYIGGPRTGKSTYFNLITEMFGEKYLASRDPHDLVSDKFAPADLHTKNINLCGDIGSATIKNFNVLKRLTGRDTITARHIYGKPFQFVNTCKLMYSCNDAPIIDDKSDAAGRRLRVVICDNSHEKIDPFYQENMVNEIEKSGLVNRAIKGLRTLIDRGDFKTTCKINTYEELSKLTSSFADDCLIITNDDDDHILTGTLHNIYAEWCRERGYPIKARIPFTIDFANKMKHHHILKTNVRVGNKVKKGFVGLIVGDIPPLSEQQSFGVPDDGIQNNATHNDDEVFNLVRTSVFKVGYTRGLKTFTSTHLIGEMEKGMNISTQIIDQCLNANTVVLKIERDGDVWTFV